jgi:D-psicose/D-tagatose/L-ribulose 3-epimerase
MKYGVNMFIWTAGFDGSQTHLLPPIKERGFDGIEVPIFDPSTFGAEAIRRAAEAHQLDVTVCTVMPPGLTVFDDDASVRAKALTYLRDCSKRIADAGATLLAGPMYSPVGYLPGRRRTETEFQRAIQCYQELAPTLVENGVTIALEPLNRFETFFLNTAADAAALCDAVGHPSVGILFDTFHANIEEKDIAQGYRTVARHLKHVHTCENDRGTPGSGHVEWAAVFAALREIGYDGWLTIESFGSTIKEIASAASIWRDIEPDHASIAFDGIGFLKQQIAAWAAAR